MPFTTNLSGTTQLDNSAVLAFDQQFIIAAGENQTLDQFAQYKKDIGAKSIDLTKYSRMAAVTSALTETDDVTSVAMADSQVLLTPAEYGAVITTTKLASLQSGGKIDSAAARLVGVNLGQSKNKLAIAALEASSNSLTVDGGAEDALTATDVMSVSFMNKLYNKLARASVQKLAGGLYVAVMHDDVAFDLREASGWIDVAKYANATSVLQNEIGSVAGFRVVINNDVSISADGGATTVDTYKTICMGANALGLAESNSPHLTITGPFDKLGRFLNVGWYGCFKYGIVDTDAVWLGITASSIGANA